MDFNWLLTTVSGVRIPPGEPFSCYLLKIRTGPSRMDSRGICSDNPSPQCSDGSLFGTGL